MLSSSAGSVSGKNRRICRFSLSIGVACVNIAAMSKPWKISVGTRLDESLVERIDAVADKLGLTRSQVIDSCCRNQIEEAEQHASALDHPLARQAMQALLRASVDTGEKGDMVRAMLEKLEGDSLFTKGEPSA